MSLLTDWRNHAYSDEMDSQKGQLFWANYFAIEKGIYEQILKNPDEVIEGTVAELAEKFDTKISIMTGFLDGINDSLINPNPIEDMTEETQVNLGIDIEKLYYNMVEARADWLYDLPEWNVLLTEEKRKELFLKQRKSNTVINTNKVGRNDPCPCGSGKKYKFCCGK